MLREGPVSLFVHGVAEYAAAVLFIAAPFLFGFDSESATAVSIVLGVIVLVVTASSDIPTGLAHTIPVGIHVVLDFITGGFLIAAPFLFGFRGEAAPTAFFLVLGVGYILLAIGTRFLPARAAVDASVRGGSGPGT